MKPQFDGEAEGSLGRDFLLAQSEPLRWWLVVKTQKKENKMKKISTCLVAIAFLAVATGVNASIINGQVLQLNFTNGYIPPPSAGNWNVYVTPNGTWNETVGTNNKMVDSLGTTLDGLGIDCSGWAGRDWSQGPVWGGVGIEPAGPKPGGGNYYIESDESNNFWFGSGSTASLKLVGLDAALTYNVKVYSTFNGSGNGGESTAMTLNGNTTASFTELARWSSLTTPYAWSGVSATVAGELVFSFDTSAGTNDNAILSAVVVEAIPEPATFSMVVLLGGAMLWIRKRSTI